MILLNEVKFTTNIFYRRNVRLVINVMIIPHATYSSDVQHGEYDQTSDDAVTASKRSRISGEIRPIVKWTNVTGEIRPIVCYLCSGFILTVL